MSDSQKSFFSGLSGAMTGLAAVLSAIVGVVGLSVSQGWIGGTKNAATSGSASGSSTTVAGGPPSSTAAVAQFSVDPSSIVFQAIGPREITVKVANTGVVPFTLQPPTIASGSNADRFTVVDQSCGGSFGGSVDPGRSCELKVTFIPKPGTFTATLVVAVTGGLRAVEVPIHASAVL